MCGRYVIAPPDEEILSMIREINRTKLAEMFREINQPPITGAGEILPSSVVPVIATSRTGEQKVFPMKWGFRQTGADGKRGKLLINARAETASEKPTFREAWQKHRCVIPASWYLEWEHIPTPLGDKTPGDKFAIMPRGARTTYLCGIYRFEDKIPHCTILTRPSGESVAGIHDRMPLILPREAIDDWINPHANPQTLLPFALTDMVIERSYC